MMRSTPGIDAGGELALREQRRDGLADDAPRRDVGEHAFEAVADFDAHALVVLGDDEDRAVVLALLADLPRVGDADAVVVDRFRRGGRHDQHHELIGRARFPRSAAWRRAPAARPRTSVSVRSVTWPLSGGTGRRPSLLVSHVAAHGDRRQDNGHRGRRQTDQYSRDGHGAQPYAPRSVSSSPAQAWAPAPPAAPGLLGEVDRRRRADRLLVVDREVGLDVHLEQHRRQVGRERTHGGVELLHRLDVAVARDGDAVLGAFELRLQVAEVLVGLEVRIVFGDDQQPRQRRLQLTLRRLELGEGRRIVDQLGRGLDAADAGARVGHFGQDAALPARRSPSRC